ncbi:hypothetical protein HDU86_005127 [Geranomyces michiganensis]|nr:hypothetical protein HDU86_005127 [Geranomyces michiganensis]
MSESPQGPSEGDDAHTDEAQEPVPLQPPTSNPDQLSAGPSASADAMNTPAGQGPPPSDENWRSGGASPAEAWQAVAGLPEDIGGPPGAAAQESSALNAPQPSSIPDLLVAEAQAFASNGPDPEPAVASVDLNSVAAEAVGAQGEADSIPTGADGFPQAESLTAALSEGAPASIAFDGPAPPVHTFDTDLNDFAQEVILPSPLFSLVSGLGGGADAAMAVPDAVREEARAFGDFDGFAAQTTSLTPITDVLGVATLPGALSDEAHALDKIKIPASDPLPMTFETSGSKPQSPSGANPEGTKEGDMDDFDDFVAPASDLAPAVSLSFLPPPSEVVASSQADDFYDDFDDFQSPATGSAPSSVPLAAPESSAGAPAGDFGDFEEFVAPAEAPTQTAIAPAAIPMSTAPLHPFFEETDSREDDGGKVLELSGAFHGQSWSLLWQNISTKTFYSDTAGAQFRWRKSHIRTAYLLGLDINIRNPDEGQKQPLVPLQREDTHTAFGQLSPSTPRFANDGVTTQSASVPIHEGGKRDSRDSELLEAKRLCEVSEDELRNQTPEQLAALMASLTAAHQKMQDQANFWLDSKEQLVMDAEMHNKMIASLVQYAQQTTQKASSSARSSSPGKKGRR